MKYFKFMLLAVLTAMFMVGCSKLDPVMDQENDNAAMKAAHVKTLDLNGPHFELNLLGKTDGFNPKEVTNPERHTMFIPRDTEGWDIQLKTPNTLGVTSLPGIRINMTQGAEFAVLDGTVFDGDACDFQLGAGQYAVYVAMRGKKNVDPAEIASWLEALETTMVDGVLTEELWYYQKLGEVTCKRSWTNITDLFTITQTEAGSLPWQEGVTTPVWIFDYMEWLAAQTISVTDPITGAVTEVTYSDLAYFWQLQNNGSQLIKVRFYPL